MDDEAKAKAFRTLAHRRHALLDASDDAESRFTFVLGRGALVTSRHLVQVVALLQAAKEIWGSRNGEHAELLGLRAARQDLNGTSSNRNIVWSGDAKKPDTVRFADWLIDQGPLV